MVTEGWLLVVVDVELVMHIDAESLFTYLQDENHQLIKMCIGRDIERNSCSALV